MVMRLAPEALRESGDQGPGSALQCSIPRQPYESNSAGPLQRGGAAEALLR